MKTLLKQAGYKEDDILYVAAEYYGEVSTHFVV